MWQNLLKISLALAVLAVATGCAQTREGGVKWNPRTQSYESRGGD